jgi:hypothetical protein
MEAVLIILGVIVAIVLIGTIMMIPELRSYFRIREM